MQHGPSFSELNWKTLAHVVPYSQFFTRICLSVSRITGMTLSFGSRKIRRKPDLHTLLYNYCSYAQKIRFKRQILALFWFARMSVQTPGWNSTVPPVAPSICNIHLRRCAHSPPLFDIATMDNSLASINRRPYVLSQVGTSSLDLNRMRASWANNAIFYAKELCCSR